MIGIYLSLIISTLHYFVRDIKWIYKKYKTEANSLVAGISVTYVFLHLFPRFTSLVKIENENLYVWVLAAFVASHLTEKYIYHHSPKDKIARKLAIEDSTISAIYHFIIGIILVNFPTNAEAILFFIPVALFTLMSSLPVDISKSRKIHFIVASSTTIGALFGKYILTHITEYNYLALLGIVIGVISFTTFRHIIPRDDNGRPGFFVTGIIIYYLILLLI